MGHPVVLVASTNITAVTTTGRVTLSFLHGKATFSELNEYWPNNFPPKKGFQSQRSLPLKLPHLTANTVGLFTKFTQELQRSAKVFFLGCVTRPLCQEVSYAT